MSWEWYEWDSLESFNAWHDSIKLTLGLPKPSVNQATGEIDELAQWTTDYTDFVEVNGKIIAVVETEHSAGLTSTDLRPPFRGFGDESES